MSAPPPDPLARAAVGLALSGRYGDLTSQAAHGLGVWAREAGVKLQVEDTGDDPRRIAETYAALAGSVELLFGPYGSGPLRAAQRGLDGRSDVLWNHGGAAGDPSPRIRVIDVLGPAESYWAGLSAVLSQKRIDPTRIVVAHAPTGFGERTADGAVASLGKVGAAPLAVATFDEGSASELAGVIDAMQATAVIACGRIEDDLALIAEIPPGLTAVGAIVAGIDLAHERLGPRVLGCFGPAQWFPTGRHPLGEGAQYPAAQAYAAGQVAAAAMAAAGSRQPDAIWDAARALRMRTLIGPFRVDHVGRQRAHRPLLVEWLGTPVGPRRRVIWRP
ncbi:MAG: ABC transporter substrate-binding protein [Thermoleophilia bacterium]|nr:ABC transporter substrate-binding protein [Thermoleophilia bacterium]